MQVEGDDVVAQATELVERVERGEIEDVCLIDVAEAADLSESSLRNFRRRANSDGSAMKSRTLKRNAGKILDGMTKLQETLDNLSVAYEGMSNQLGLHAAEVDLWLQRHEGAYICYRHASSDDLIQVSRLEIFRAGGRARYRHHHHISDPHLGEGEVRTVVGDVFPLQKCAHFIHAKTGEMRHIMMAEIVERGHVPYMLGILTAFATDQSAPFAARILAIKVSPDPTFAPDDPAALGISFPTQKEGRQALILDVVPAEELPTICAFLEHQHEKGVLRAEASSRRMRRSYRAATE